MAHKIIKLKYLLYDKRNNIKRSININIIMTKDCSLYELLYFKPIGEDEKNLFDFDKSIINRFIADLNNDIFYLGGQIKMKSYDIINLESIQQVREINKQRELEYGGPANGFEAASIYRVKHDLHFIENMIIQYNLIMENREKEKYKLDEDDFHQHI